MPAAFITKQILRFCDTDAMGHVNNAVYSVMYEAGRSELAIAAGLMPRNGGFGMVIARMELDFLREMTWPGEVTIETWLARIGDKSLHARQRLLVEGTVVSRAASVLAIIDMTSRRAIPVTGEWRAVLEQWVLPEAA